MTSIETINTIPQTKPDQQDRISIWHLLVFGLLGVFISAIAVPILVPGLLQSVAGGEPKVYWFLSRGTAIVSYLFLWVSMVLGLLITSKTAKYFPGAFTANDLHQFLSISGLLAGLIHGLLLTGDRYININLGQVLTPFSFDIQGIIWVGIGQIAIYVWAVMILSFYIKKWIGYKIWRIMHFVGFLVFVGVLLHGIMAGTDTSNLLMQFTYWVSGGFVLLLTLYRMLAKSV